MIARVAGLLYGAAVVSLAVTLVVGGRLLTLGVSADWLVALYAGGCLFAAGCFATAETLWATKHELLAADWGRPDQ